MYVCCVCVLRLLVRRFRLVYSKVVWKKSLRLLSHKQLNVSKRTADTLKCSQCTVVVFRVLFLVATPQLSIPPRAVSNVDPLQLSLHIHPFSALPPSELFCLSTSKTSLFFTQTYFHVCNHLFTQALVYRQICQHSSNAILCSLHFIHALSLSAMASLFIYLSISRTTRKEIWHLCVFCSLYWTQGRTKEQFLFSHSNFGNNISDTAVRFSLKLGYDVCRTMTSLFFPIKLQQLCQTWNMINK